AFVFSSRRRHTRFSRDWSSDVCSSDLADCLRLYEMFLGPLEQSKPWNTQGLSGVYGFLKKFYNLYFDGDSFNVSDEEPTKEEYRSEERRVGKEGRDRWWTER